MTEGTDDRSWWDSSEAEYRAPTDLRTDVPHTARMYDYWLGGKDHFAADREGAERAAAVFPGVRLAARANRRFLGRAVRWLVREAGIRQFLDIGTGIPTAANTHVVAQQAAPDSRVVYVDNDPIVLAHARALLTSTPQGRTAFIDADLRKPETILEHPTLRGTLDLDQPVALLLVAILHFFPDSAGDDDPFRIVRRLVDALPSGSYLTLTHATADFAPTEWNAFLRVTRDQNGIPGQLRSREEVLGFFDRLDLVAPGLEPVYRWHPDGDEPESPEELLISSVYGAVARKP